MNAIAINEHGAVFYVHVSAITSPVLVKKYGTYSVNFFSHAPLKEQSAELVSQAVVGLMTNPSYKGWSFQVV